MGGGGRGGFTTAAEFVRPAPATLHYARDRCSRYGRVIRRGFLTGEHKKNSNSGRAGENGERKNNASSSSSGSGCRKSGRAGRSTTGTPETETVNLLHDRKYPGRYKNRV